MTVSQLDNKTCIPVPELQYLSNRRLKWNNSKNCERFRLRLHQMFQKVSNFSRLVLLMGPTLCTLAVSADEMRADRSRNRLMTFPSHIPPLQPDFLPCHALIRLLRPTCGVFLSRCQNLSKNQGIWQLSY